ncbi:MAG: hypothetical protein K0U29_05145, partial [Gammaproteobacteria bacterium]|nr:hypothetical protein [Gammaproteobacteria bacterium]
MPDFSNIRNLIVVARDTYGGGIPATLLGLAENMCLYGYNGAIRVVTSNGGSTFKRLLGLPLSENTFSLNDTLCSNNPHALTFHTASETLPIADLALISPMDPLREYARINVGVHWNIGFKKSFRLYVRLFGMDHLEGSHYGHPQAWFSLPPIDPKILNAQRQRFRILAPIKADLIKQILQTPSTNAEIAIIYSQNILNIKHSILKHMQVIHERNPTKEMYLLTGMISPETWGFLQENFPQFNFTDSDQASSVNTVKNFLINPKNNSLVVRIPGTPSTIYRDLLPRITIANFEGSGSLSAFAHAAQQRTKESCFSPDRSMRTHIYKLPMNASLAKLARVAPIYRGNSRATGLVDYFKKKPLTPIEIREFAGLLDKCVETNTFGFYSNQTNATVIDDLSRAVAPGAIKYEPPFRTQGFTLGNAACIGLLGITNGILCNNFKYGLSMQLLLTYLLNISGVLS